MHSASKEAGPYFLITVATTVGSHFFSGVGCSRGLKPPLPFTAIGVLQNKKQMEGVGVSY